jgi:hypothetical protein
LQFVHWRFWHCCSGVMNRLLELRLNYRLVLACLAVLRLSPIMKVWKW